MTGIWAHRGASAVAPENTVAAFRAAVALGADGVELDVRRTADGHPAVHHDAALPDGRLLAELAAADLPVEVPLLGAALDACGDLVVNIEIKEPPELAEVVVAEVRNRGLAGRVVVSCFELATVDRVRHLDDGIPTALLSTDAADLARCDGHAAFHPWDGIVEGALVEAAHALGLAVNVWTVDDPGRVAALAAMGVDAVVTNDVAAARSALLRP